MKPKTLQQAIKYLSDEQVCIDTVAELRWPNGPVCPRCEGKEHYYLATQKRWKCKNGKCGKQFSVKAGTIFEDSAIPLDKWLIALWMLVNCKNGVSSYEIHRALGITQKSAWFVMHRLRLALQNGTTLKLGGEGKEIEADESFIGGAARFMHADRRKRMIPSTGVGGKAAAFGILERGGEVRVFAVPGRHKRALQSHIQEHVREGTPVYTDAFMSYVGLNKKFQHRIIDHAEKYVEGRVHTNGLENFWSLLKRGLKGTYVSTEPFHLFRYLDEQAWRYNNRGSKDNPVHDGERFLEALSRIAGKRLTFAEVT
jgi:transposase-like protein